MLIGKLVHLEQAGPIVLIYQTTTQSVIHIDAVVQITAPEDVVV
jgi:hypothetical protein